MCIIVYKKLNQKFPSKETLKHCFENNPDGAGFMYPYAEKVNISKGFNTFKKFWKALQNTRKITGDDIPYIMHFRISTQAHGRMDCTHPFPLSKDMGELRKLDCSCNIGIAHNGIISLTSSGYSKTITYSDTMQFITDYLTLIIKNKDYYKDETNIKLIDKLCGGKLAIMDNTGYVQLIGDFVEDDGIIYSNGSYKKYQLKATTYKQISYYDDIYDYDEYQSYFDKNYYDYYEKYFDEKSGLYKFDKLDCPMSYSDDDAYDYCEQCHHYKDCYKDVKDFSDDEEY